MCLRACVCVCGEGTLLVAHPFGSMLHREHVRAHLATTKRAKIHPLEVLLKHLLEFFPQGGLDYSFMKGRVAAVVAVLVMS